MGHQRLGELFRSLAWDAVVDLIACRADTAQIAQAAIRAVECGLQAAHHDRGVVQTVLLLLQLPHAARQTDYLDRLEALGLRFASDPSVLELVAAFTRAIDARLPGNAGRTDLGEMAQMAAAETFSRFLHERTGSLFAVGTEMVRAELGRLDTVSQFGQLGHHFFGKFVFKALDYYIGRATPLHLGEGKRFLGLDAVGNFHDALELHCHQVAAVVRWFCGDWKSKALYEHGTIEAEHARDFVCGAMKKLIDGLKHGEACLGS